MFNQPLDIYSSNSLKHLEFGSESFFNQTIDNLPPSLEFLQLGIHFNQPINNLPNSLKELRILGIFNYPVDYLPNSLERLKLGWFFNQPIDNLPHSLKLSLKSKFSMRVNHHKVVENENE